MNYVVVVFDLDGNRVAALENAYDLSYNRAKNSANQINVTIPRSDPKVSEIQIGSYFEVLRGDINDDILEVSGYITDRGYTDEGFEISGFTEEIILSRYRTPDNYGYPLWSENQNLASFFEQFRHGFYVRRMKGEWTNYLFGTQVNVDFEVNPQMVLLNGTPGAGDDPTTYPAYGTARFRFDTPNIWESTTLERIRWVSDYDPDEVVRTTIQYQQSGSYSPEIPGALTDVVGVLMPDPSRSYVYVRVNFDTEEPTATPVLFSLEAVHRFPIKGISQVAYQDVDGYYEAVTAETPHLEANSRSMLDVLIDVCEVVEWEFRLIRGVLFFSKDFGTNRTNSYTLVEA